MTEPKCKIIHIHAPKTGGTWFNSVMKAHMPDHFVAGDHTRFELAADGHLVPPMWMGASGVKKIHITMTGVSADGSIRNNILAGSEYLKVGIIRNPFETLVSYWSHNHPDDRARAPLYGLPAESPVGWDRINVVHGIHDFDGFIKRLTDPEFPWHHHLLALNLHGQYVSDRGRETVDVILRNERLSEATAALLKTVGVEPRPELLAAPRKNTSSHRDYRSYYTDELRELVEAHYATDIARWGYNFDGPTADWPLISLKIKHRLPDVTVDVSTITL